MKHTIFDFTHIYIHRNPVDMRKSITGLSMIVDKDMGLSLQGRNLFLFINKRRTHMKALYFDRTGFAIWFKRLEESKFPWPKLKEESVVMATSEEIEQVLEGIDVWKKFIDVEFERID